LAHWLTESDWFAAAIVNRLWSELVGEGFYDSVEDIGPDRQPKAPAAIGLLSEKFQASGFDLKWLLETICQTDVYQREARPRRDSDSIPFTANLPQRLRGDQLFNALLSVLEIEENVGKNRRRSKPGQAKLRVPRKAFNLVFGYDPSASREEVASSIPQALALMNGPQFNRALLGRNKRTLLGHLLTEITDENSLIEELYLRCLSREPTAGELARALNYLEEMKSDHSRWRQQAYEDLLWALINSVEFRYRM